MSHPQEVLSTIKSAQYETKTTGRKKVGELSIKVY
jgi:hypothetical protein